MSYLNWEQRISQGNTNFYLSGGKFYICYSACPADTLESETALCIFNEEDGSMDYLILKGDWRKQYEPLVPQGIESCLELFEKNAKEHALQRDTVAALKFILVHIEKYFKK